MFFRQHPSWSGLAGTAGSFGDIPKRWKVLEARVGLATALVEGEALLRLAKPFLKGLGSYVGLATLLESVGGYVGADEALFGTGKGLEVVQQTNGGKVVGHPRLASLMISRHRAPLQPSIPQPPTV